MEESRFKEELHRFDKSLWLQREDDSYSIMGFDAVRKVYCAVSGIPLGSLGGHIIQNIYACTPWRNGGTVDAFCDKLDEGLDGYGERDEHKDERDDVAKQIEFVLKSGSRVSVGGFEVTDSRRVLDV